MIDTTYTNGRTPKIERLEKEFFYALAGGDNEKARDLCAKLGREPDLPELESNSFRLEQRTVQKPKRKISQRTERIYDAALELTKGTSIEPDNIFAQIDWKREILIKAGYTHLIGRDGERVTTETAKDSRIGKVFKRVYNAARKYRDL